MPILNNGSQRLPRSFQHVVRRSHGYRAPTNIIRSVRRGPKPKALGDRRRCGFFLWKVVSLRLRCDHRQSPSENGENIPFDGPNKRHDNYEVGSESILHSLTAFATSVVIKPLQ